MFKTVLEYITNADMFYRLWMVAQMQREQPRIMHFDRQWLPQLVDQFDDISDVPSYIRCNADAVHRVDNHLRFHTDNTKPTMKVSKMECGWGISEEDCSLIADRQSVDSLGHAILGPLHFRTDGPCKVTFNGLKFWHHQDTVHRRRGDAVTCDMATFEWNTKRNSQGSFRETGPFQVVIQGFRASYDLGVATDASYDGSNRSWGTENGIRLGDSKVNSIIMDKGIRMNCLLTDSVFKDEGEEFIFWDEIGRAQN
jgi:hypothetical protein